MSRNAEEQMLASIYEAAVDPSQWELALAQVAREINASSAFFFSTHSDTEPDAVIHTLNQAPDMAEAFTSHWHTEDAWAIAAAQQARMSRGTLVTGHELVAPDAFRRTAFHGDFCRQHEIESMVGAVLFDGTEADAMPFVNLCWYRPAGHDEFGEPEKRTLSRVLPHFQRALRIQRRVAWATDQRAARALAALHVASLVLDRSGAVRQANDAASAWLRTLPAGCHQGGKLRALGARSAPLLDDALRACRAGHPVRIAALQGEREPVMRATLLWLDPASRLVPGQDQERYLLVVELPGAGTQDAAQAAARLFGLSPAETRVVARLLAGDAPAAIAQRLGISVPTVRTQMSSIFAKTGTTGQVELLLRLRGLNR